MGCAPFLSSVRCPLSVVRGGKPDSGPQVALRPSPATDNGPRTTDPRRMLFRLDGDLARPGGFVLVQLHPQHAVLEAGVHLVGIDGERQRQDADEAPEAALLAVPDGLLRD